MIPPVAIKALLIAAVVVALGFAWNGFIKHEQNVGYQKAVAEYNVKLIEAKEAADKREQELSAQVQEAQSGEQAKIAQFNAKLEEARINAQADIERANIDATTKREIAQLQITSEEELEEMRGYFELLKARSAPPSPALTQDVEQDFQPEQEDIPLPKIIMRKRIQMVAPSGAVYSGTIHDEPMEDWGMPQ